jgi:hypothetical protein
MWADQERHREQDRRQREDAEADERRQRLDAIPNAPIVMRNECDVPVKFIIAYIAHETDASYTTKGPWTIEQESREGSFLRRLLTPTPELVLTDEQGSPLRHVKNYKLFLYAETVPDDGKPWKGAKNLSHAGREYPMTDANPDLNDDGQYIIRLIC